MLLRAQGEVTNRKAGEEPMAEVTLYWAKGTCSLASMAALSIAGIPFTTEEVVLRGTRHNLPDMAPSRRIPLLAADGALLNETVAIIAWADANTRGPRLLPDRKDLAQPLSRMVWLASRVHPLRRQFHRPGQFDPDPALHDSLSASALPKYRSEIDELDAAVGRGEFAHLGPACYAMLFYHWAKFDGVLDARHTSLRGLAISLAREAPIRSAIELHGWEADA